jgi:hypothetical protein
MHLLGLQELMAIQHNNKLIILLEINQNLSDLQMKLLSLLINNKKIILFFNFSKIELIIEI